MPLVQAPNATARHAIGVGDDLHEHQQGAVEDARVTGLCDTARPHHDGTERESQAVLATLRESNGTEAVQGKNELDQQKDDDRQEETNVALRQKLILCSCHFFTLLPLSCAPYLIGALVHDD